MKILILALTSGEADLPMHHASVASQTGASIDYLEIAGLDNLPAHRRLYETIHERAADYDAFIKLDGDMVFRDAGCALRMALSLSPVNHHVMFPVLDYLTRTKIHGIHVFSPHCHWNLEAICEPFVDPQPAGPGTMRIVPLSGWAPVFHGHFMSMEQAFAFGQHRARKCFQKRQPQDFQLKILHRIWMQYGKDADPLRGAAMMGAELVRRSGMVGDYKSIDGVSPFWKLATQGDAAAIRRQCRPYWSVMAPVWMCFNFFTKAWNYMFRASSA